MDATISEAPSGRSDVMEPHVPEVSDPVESAGETATAQIQTDGRVEDTTPEVNSDETANVVPEATVDTLQQEIKDFKSHFTQKSQGFSEEKKLWELERNQFESQLDQMTKISKQLLQDDDFRNQQRQAFGVNASNFEVPELKTHEDLQNYLSTVIPEIEKRAVEKARAEANTSSLNTVESLNRQNRWVNAQTVLSKDPIFSENLDRINRLVETKYSNDYSGDNEMDVYQKAFTDITNEVSRYKELGKQEAFESLKKKQAAATSVPQKSISTTGQKAGSAKRSVEEMIAAANAKVRS